MYLIRLHDSWYHAHPNKFDMINMLVYSYADVVVNLERMSLLKNRYGDCSNANLNIIRLQHWLDGNKELPLISISNVRELWSGGMREHPLKGAFK